MSDRPPIDATTPLTHKHAELMRNAIEVCRAGIKAGQSPFGALIASTEGDILCTAHNMVRVNCDATAHAEVMAIRNACAKLGTTYLNGHVLVTTCEPCPMCAAAIHWSKIDSVVYGASISDAKRACFSELTVPTESLYREGGSHVRVYPKVLRDECVKLFDEWKNGPNPNPY